MILDLLGGGGIGVAIVTVLGVIAAALGLFGLGRRTQAKLDRVQREADEAEARARGGEERAAAEVQSRATAPDQRRADLDRMRELLARPPIPGGSDAPR